MMPQARFPLLSCNTFGVDAHAEWGMTFTSVAQLVAILQDARWATLPRVVLGGGSNVLFTCDFAGLVLINGLRGIEFSEQAEAWTLHVAAGENWHQLVQYTLQHGMPGLENLALIPGSVGAAPVQNIGAYGVEMARYCTYVEALDTRNWQVVRIAADQCGFGYRESHFKQAWRGTHIITAVGLRLPKQWQPVVDYGPLRALPAPVSAQAIFDTVCAVRQEKLPDPQQLGNAGSFFKNPTVSAALADSLSARYPTMPRYAQADGQVKLAAGWLIDQAGFKGYQQGRAAVHAQQALVLVNLGGAEASEILALAAEVQSGVAVQFGVTLEPEVRFVGARGDTTLQEVQACAI